MNQGENKSLGNRRWLRRALGDRTAIQVAGRVFLILLPALLCTAAVIQTHKEIRSARLACQTAEAELQRLKMEKARLQEEVEALRKDPAAIEKAARTELRMVRKDELVLSFPDREKKGQEAGTSRRKKPAPAKDPTHLQPR